MPINWHYSNYRQIYRYRKIEILKLSKNYQYRKMHQIWSDKFFESLTNISQENVGTNTPSCLLTINMLCLFDPFLHFFGQHLILSVAYFLWRIQILPQKDAIESTKCCPKNSKMGQGGTKSSWSEGNKGYLFPHFPEKY